MESDVFIEKVENEEDFSGEDIRYLLTTGDRDFLEDLSSRSYDARVRYFGTGVFLRGLVEITGYCRNDCLYCGLRRSNCDAHRYRMTSEAIVDSCHKGYSLGLRTFVLQGGEDSFFNDDMLCGIISEIKDCFRDCAVTLSLGERSYESYARLFAAGADRYLLRHETADKVHYRKLHPEEMSFENRKRCLDNLKAIGFQTGCGFMVGSPFQTYDSLAADINYIRSFKPHMCGIGPFISHRQTPFSGYKNGSAEHTLRLLQLIRLLIPDILLPATTALGISGNDGLAAGIVSGANVIMPNITPAKYIKKYDIYDGKGSVPQFSMSEKNILENRLSGYGFVIDYGRGDSRR